MLSYPPLLPFSSFPKFSFKKVFKAYEDDILFNFSSNSLIVVLDLGEHSQIPSHPIKMYLSSSKLLFTQVISGSAIIICYNGFTFFPDLKAKSPNPLETFIYPLILPPVTVPPA